MRYESDEMEIDLRELLYVLRRKIAIILLTAFIFAGGAGVYSFFIADPVYESTSRLYIQTQSTSITSLADIQVGSSLALDYVELIQSRTLCQEVIDNLKLDVTYKDLQKCLHVTNPENTRILNISIRGTDAKSTAVIANEFAMVARKQISDVMKTDEPSVWEVAITPKKPVAPEKSKNVALAFIIGALLTAMGVVVRYLMDDAIRTQDDIERHLGLNTLAHIPQVGEKEKKSKKNKLKRSKKVKVKKRRKGEQ